jgi:hypothetical protein
MERHEHTKTLILKCPCLEGKVIAEPQELIRSIFMEIRGEV